MPVPPLELTDWQYDLGGVLMGAGTSVQVIETTGLGRPPSRDNDADQPSMDGVFAGPDYYAARQVQFDAAVRIPGNPAACHDVVAALQATADNPAVRLTGGATMPLRMKRPGRPVKRLNGRLRKVDVEYKQVVHGYVPLDIEFAATDPTFYADEQTTTEIPLGWLTGGGFAAPVVAPIFVQSGTTAADRPGWVTNAGTGSAWPVIRITGPVANVTVTHTPSGRQLAMPTLNLTSRNQWVEIDTRPGYRTVRRENGGNASTVLSAASRIDLFSLPPGQSEMRWTGFDNTNTARMRLTWRDAYTAL
ncbi:phage tail family protein [Streptomyces sp. NBC_01221]|uniref:phage tail domain-containing protein n=1 Tax=Streptomyces sp. NBC_01221 TaxID=2903782 RepID=UPI002256B54B|nr:phage tail domain-containing protein [Streptomyces sp. NBC_01221]MCX4792487.1 phage tail family protein [Streptomyces sp. NBC_01221]